MRRRSRRNWETNALECDCQIKHHRDLSLLFFARAVSTPFHLEQNLPHSAPRSSMSLHPTRCHCCHLVTSGARNPSLQRIKVGKRATGHSLATFLGIKINIVVQACCGHLPHCSLFQKKNNLTSRFDCQVQRNFGVSSIIRHPQLPSNTSLPPPFSSSFGLCRTFLQTSQLIIPARLVLQILHLREPTLSSSPHLFRSSASHSNSSNTYTPPLQAVGFVILWREPAFRTSHHTAHQLLVSFCPIFLIFFFNSNPATNYTISAPYPPILDEATPFCNHQPAILCPSL